MRKIHLMHPSKKLTRRVRREVYDRNCRDIALRKATLTNSVVASSTFHQSRIETEKKIMGPHFGELIIKHTPLPFEARRVLIKTQSTSPKYSGFQPGPYRISRTRAMLQYFNKISWMDLEARKLLASGDLYRLSWKEARNVVLQLYKKTRMNHTCLLSTPFPISPLAKREGVRWNYLKRVTHREESWHAATLRFQYPSSMRTQTSCLQHTS